MRRTNFSVEKQRGKKDDDDDDDDKSVDHVLNRRFCRRL